MSDANSNRPVEYRELPEFPGYRFGSDGSIWSRWGKGAKSPSQPWSRMLLRRHRSGHLWVNLRSVSGPVNTGAHRLICMAFHGPPPAGTECRHLDGNPSNNRPGNLAWGTRAQNIDDQRKHGVLVRGERAAKAKLNEASVAEIRRLYAAGGETFRSLAARFGVAHCTIKQVVHRTTWGHLAGPDS